MSDLPLPEDIDDWPDDPFKLLGVRQGTGKSEVRRAYTRLIRVYKPDHYPAEFRRLREAYEWLLQLAEMYGWDEVTEEEETNLPDRAAPVDSSSEAINDSAAPAGRMSDEAMPPLELQTVPHNGAPAGPAVRSLEEELAEAWQLAVAGDAALALRRLMDLHDRDYAHPDICLRIYWLLKLHPGLPQNNDGPCDWLIRGMKRTRGSGPLGVLYVREIARHPDEAFSARCRELLEWSAGSPWVLTLADARWKAASAGGRWRLIDEDLELLRPKLERTDGATWLRLLFCAVQEWVRSPSLPAQSRIQSLADEIEAVPEVGAAQQYDLHRLDFFREFAEQWCHQGKTLFMAEGLGQAIAASWGRSPEEYASKLFAYLANLVATPAQELDGLDFLQRNAPLVLARFGDLLESFRSYREIDEDEWPEEELTQVVSDFLDSEFWEGWYYSKKVRFSIYEFCCREMVSLEQILRYMHGNSSRVLKGGGDLAATLHDDWPLRYACLAYRVFVK